jgi:hypothetical protein
MNRRRAVSTYNRRPDPHSPPPVHGSKKPLKYSTAKWVLKIIVNTFSTDIIFNGFIFGTNASSQHCRVERGLSVAPRGFA